MSRIRKRLTSRMAMLIASTVALSLAPTTASAAKKEMALEPVTPWNAEWGKESCILRRGFGTKDNMSVVQFESFAQSRIFRLWIVNNDLNLRSHGKRLLVSFGENAPQDKSESYMPWASDDGSQSIFLWDAAIGSQEELEQRHAHSLPAMENAAKRMTIETKRLKVIFETGRLGKPFEALRNCVDSLVESWGFDAEVQRSLNARPVPSRSPGTWISVSDYPASVLQHGTQAFVHFRLGVSAEGVPDKCTVQSALSNDDFDEITCENLLRRARFKPALDKDDKPVASYFKEMVVLTVF